jgi:CRP-like cAMP-binding protein
MITTTRKAQITETVSCTGCGTKMCRAPPIATAVGDPRENGLLASLPDAEYELWRPHLQLVYLTVGQVLQAPGTAMSYSYFPSTAIVSLLCVTVDGSSAETALVGNEGMVGVASFMGGGATPSQAVVQSGGTAYRLSIHEVKVAFERGGAPLHLLLRYTQALITQMAQTAACNRHHTIRQQLCRSLLLSLDRVSGNELVMTQELIARMLGVRREGITAEAGKLQMDHAIRYNRGRITVLDRAKLEAGSCECYAVIKTEYDRLLPVCIAT